MVDSAECIAGGHFFQTDGSCDVACENFLDFFTFVSVHLQQTTDTFFLTLDGVQNGVAGVNNAGVHAKEGQLTDERVSHDLEGKSGERLFIISLTTSDRIVIRINTLDRRNVNRARKQFNNSVKHALNTLVLERCTAEHRLNFVGDGTQTQTLVDVGLGEVAVVQVLVHQFFVSFGSSFNHVAAPFFGFFNQLGGNVFEFELHALRSFIPNDGFSLGQIDNAFESVFSTDRNNDRYRISFQTSLHLIVNFEEVCACTVHLVHESKTGNFVFVSLTPNSFGLRLDTADSTVNHAGTVQNTHGTFNFNSEVNVSRGINNVDTVFGMVHVHTAPESSSSSGGNRNAAFLFLFHPVHGRSAIVHFANLVINAGVEQNAFRGGCFARVDVRGNADIAITLNRSFASHVSIL